MLGASKTTGCVLDVASPVGSVAPGVVTLLDRSRMKNNGTTMTAITWSQLPSKLWVMVLNGATSKVAFAASLCKVQTFVAWVYPTTANRSIVDFDAGTHSIETTAAPAVTATGWAAPIIYVNGVLASAVILNKWYMVAGTTTTSFTMSALVLGQEASYFAGSMTCVKAFSYALTPAQVRNIYNRERRFFPDVN
jgi:hypothetical protein